MSRYQTAASHAHYLDGRIRTASQPEMQLMLLDGAAKFARQAQQLWNDDDQRDECERLVGRVLDIVAELARSVAGGAIEAAKRLEEEYAFAFRQLAAAQVFHDAAALAAAQQVIEFHRETWKLACEKLAAAEPDSTAATAAAPRAGAPQLSPHAAFGDPSASSPRLSLEA
jgi:flagellar secretion chaperone FliS